MAAQPKVLKIKPLLDRIPAMDDAGLSALRENAERLSREGGTGTLEAEGWPTALLRRFYTLVYGPQDRLAEWLVARRPALTSQRSVSLLANLGMSTQLAALGILIAVWQHDQDQPDFAALLPLPGAASDTDDAA